MDLKSSDPVASTSRSLTNQTADFARVVLMIKEEELSDPVPSTSRSMRMKTRSMTKKESNRYTHLDLSFSNLDDDKLTLLLRIFLAHNLNDSNSSDPIENIVDDCELITDRPSKRLDISFAELAELFIYTPTTLRYLNLLGNDLSGKDSDLLAQVVSRMRSVDLSWTCLTTEQCTAILSLIKTSPASNVKVLNMVGVNLSMVDKDLLAEAIAGLRTVDLTETQLSTAQCTALLKKCEESNHWMNINLHDVDLSGVPCDILEKAEDLCNLHLLPDYLLPLNFEPAKNISQR